MVIFLLIASGIFIFCGLPEVHWETLAPTMENVMPNGARSFFAGAVVLSFACGGAHFIAENGDDIEKAYSIIPKVIIMFILHRDKQVIFNILLLFADYNIT